MGWFTVVRQLLNLLIWKIRTMCIKTAGTYCSLDQGPRVPHDSRTFEGSWQEEGDTKESCDCWGTATAGLRKRVTEKWQHHGHVT